MTLHSYFDIFEVQLKECLLYLFYFPIHANKDMIELSRHSIFHHLYPGLEGIAHVGCMHCIFFIFPHKDAIGTKMSSTYSIPNFDFVP